MSFGSRVQLRTVLVCCVTVWNAVCCVQAGKDDDDDPEQFTPRVSKLWRHNHKRVEFNFAGDREYSFSFYSKYNHQKQVREAGFEVADEGYARRQRIPHPGLGQDFDYWVPRYNDGRTYGQYVDDFSVDSDVKKPITSAERQAVETFVNDGKIMKHSSGLWTSEPKLREFQNGPDKKMEKALKDLLVGGGGNVFGGWGMFVFDYYRNPAEAQESHQSNDRHPHDFTDRVKKMGPNYELTTDDYKIPQMHVADLDQDLQSFFDIKVMKIGDRKDRTPIFSSEKGGAAQIGHFTYKKEFVRDFVYDTADGSKGTYIEYHPFPHFITPADSDAYVRELVGRRVGSTLYLVDLMIPFGYGLWLGKNVIHNDAACLGNIFIFFETENGEEDSVLLKGSNGAVARVFKNLETDDVIHRVAPAQYEPDYKKIETNSVLMKNLMMYGSIPLTAIECLQVFLLIWILVIVGETYGYQIFSEGNKTRSPPPTVIVECPRDSDTQQKDDPLTNILGNLSRADSKVELQMARSDRVFAPADPEESNHMPPIHEGIPYRQNMIVEESEPVSFEQMMPRVNSSRNGESYLETIIRTATLEPIMRTATLERTTTDEPLLRARSRCL